MLHRAPEIRPDAHLVLITGGTTDGDQLRIAAEESGRSDLEEPIQFMPAHGATRFPP
jgi:hypothetical protein